MDLATRKEVAIIASYRLIPHTVLGRITLIPKTKVQPNALLDALAY